MIPRTFTTAEVSELTGLSRARLHQLREGYVNRRKSRTGEAREYAIAPRLIEGEDWHWDRGRVVYHRSALKKLGAR